MVMPHKSRSCITDFITDDPAMETSILADLAKLAALGAGREG